MIIEATNPPAPSIAGCGPQVRQQKSSKTPPPDLDELLGTVAHDTAAEVDDHVIRRIKGFGDVLTSNWRGLELRERCTCLVSPC
jgi:hypothetical protein